MRSAISPKLYLLALVALPAILGIQCGGPEPDVVECNVADDCTPGGECTVTVCGDGACDTQTASDGAPCDYGAPGDGQCSSGVCEPTNCVPACVDSDADDCTEPFCPQGSTQCSTRFRPEDSDCRTNNADGKCTVDGDCDLCAGKACAAPSECKEDSSCDTDTGLCLPFEDKPDGTPCSQGACQGGVCRIESVFPCSEQGIRDAIRAGGGPHTFDCADGQEIRTSAEIVIDNDVILDGRGELTIQPVFSQFLHRVFSVPKTSTVELRRFNIEHGESTEGGGCIKNEGTLTLEESLVRYCKAVGSDGGGIWNSGDVTLIETELHANNASGPAPAWNLSGGGIWNGGGLRVRGGRISHNRTTGYGGGIRSTGPTTVSDCTVGNNRANSHGGGILVDGEDTRFSLYRSTLIGNRAPMGSAIYLANGVLGLVQTSTVTENLAQTEERNLGAIYVKDSDLDLVHSTVAWNTSYSEGWTKQGGDVVHLGEGLLWFERTAIVGDDCDESHGVARFTGSRNLESPGNTCGLEDDGNYVSIPEELVALGRAADNGVGETSTRTCLPASNSFLVDRIPTNRCTSRSDQRGVPRPQGDSCDIGAVERAPFDP